jgi:hypothetical protein
LPRTVEIKLPRARQRALSAGVDAAPAGRRALKSPGESVAVERLLAGSGRRTGIDVLEPMIAAARARAERERAPRGPSSARTRKMVGAAARAGD